MYDTREVLVGVPKVTREELIRSFPHYFKKRTARRRPAGVAPKVKSAE